jgi:hypothetical protein
MDAPLPDAPEVPGEYRVVDAPSAGPQAPRSGRTVAVVAVVVVLVAAGILGGLYVAHLGPFQGSPQPPSGPVTFGQAELAGAATASGYGGGSWDLIAAGAADVNQSESFTPASIGLGVASILPNCPIKWLTDAATITVPAFHGNAAAGVSPFWELAYRNASSGGGILLISVTNGTGALTALLPGVGGCATYSELATFVAPVSGATWDSPAVISAVNAAGGDAFLAAHPAATVTMGVSGEFVLATISEPSVWSVAYTLCALGSSGPTAEPEFNATVNAVSGAVTFAHEGLVNCTGVPGESPPPPSSFSLGTSLNWSSASPAGTPSNHWVNATVLAATNGVNFADLEVSVVGPGGTITPNASWSLSVRTSTGGVIATYNLTSTQCESGGQFLVEVGDVLSVYSSSTSLVGGSITVTGVGPFVGFERLPIS